MILAQQSVAPLNLQPISKQAWTPSHAVHLASRAGFGASAQTLSELAALSPLRAVRYFTHSPRWRAAPNFIHSGVFEDALDPFPSSRPATTALAKKQGHALGVMVKPSGNRPIQGVVNKFFYWLRASRLETDRVAYWWAQRMLTTPRPLQEKMALFWHGHFATNEDKVRDYRKMLQQIELFQQLGLGDFRELLIAVAQDPAMLVFLDAGVNTADSPNENFAREIMELFTMGVGHYSETDVQEAARAFTGWNVEKLKFTAVSEDHDGGEKVFLGHRGDFDGVEIIGLILQQDKTGDYLAAKLYRYFVNEDLSVENEAQLGDLFRRSQFDIAKFLQHLFLSEDFYSPRNIGSRIKSPVELLVSTYRSLGLVNIPGTPDFNVASGSLGQRLLHPPTVAGWSQGRSWITPSLLYERSNFVLDVLFPDIGFVPPDRYPSYTSEIVNVQNRLRQGMSVSLATKPTGVDTHNMAASNLLADRDEAFNTRLGSMRGWQTAIQRVKPIPRDTAQVDLTTLVLKFELSTPRAVVEYFAQRFFVVGLEESTLQDMTLFFAAQIGTQDVLAAQSYLEEPLRKLLHQLLSLPEYQLG
ncbi:MAG: DUF1800 domain-containing protein [Gammaproteobacteria bacterium]|nr:DUF1800 domain-containing protein [Gammaproteobacteria bacterium]